MEQEVVLIASAALGALVGGLLLKRVFLISLCIFGMGLVELYFGFRHGAMFWSRTRGSGPGAWLSYEGNKRAFAFMGFLFSFGLLAGTALILMVLFDKKLSQRS
jgi:hypothetical protein